MAYYRFDLRFCGWLQRTNCKVEESIKAGKLNIPDDELRRIRSVVGDLAIFIRQHFAEQEIESAVRQEQQNPNLLPKDDPDTLCALGITTTGICTYLNDWKPEYACWEYVDRQPPPSVKPSPRPSIPHGAHGRPATATKGDLFSG